MAEITNLGYAVFGVSDLDRWEEFASLLGFQTGRREDKRAIALRIDSYEQRVVLEKGAEDDIRAAGWELDNEEALESYVAQLGKRGLSVEACSADQAAERRVHKLYSCLDPNGFRHEFYCSPSIAVTAFKSPMLSSGGFNTGPLGLGHLLVCVEDLKGSIAFCRGTLGLRLSDRIREEVAPGMVVDATFFHARTGRHHSLAVAGIPSPKKLGHIMVEVESVDDVGRAYDRCLKAGYEINASLGHHPNDHMFSFYVATPSGFSLEYGAGGIVIDDSNWQAKTYNKLSDWGHQQKVVASKS
jgi:2,3-dihydroxybiphenyl 1,2-dioxygenase